MSGEVTATDIIDSVTEYARDVTRAIWARDGVTGTRDEFLAATLRVFAVELDKHLARLDAREPGKAQMVRELFCAEHEAREHAEHEAREHAEHEAREHAEQ